MELFGFPMTTVYLILLFAGVSLAFLYVFIGEMLEGLLDFAGDAVNSVTFIGFITLVGGIGFAGEVMGIGTSVSLFLITIAVAAIISGLINLFIIIPMKKQRRKKTTS
jgi:hypothetical protein